MHDIILIIPVTILIFVTACLLLVPVVITFSMESSLSANLRIKIYAFNLGVENLIKPIKWKNIDFAFLLFSEYAAVKQILYFCFRFIKTLTVSKRNYINMSLTGGFGSPDVTGVVLGAIETVRPAFGKNTRIVYYPDMISPAINVRLNAQSKIRIYGLLLEAAPLIFRLPVLKIVRIIIKIKKGEYDVRTT